MSQDLDPKSRRAKRIDELETERVTKIVQLETEGVTRKRLKRLAAIDEEISELKAEP